jgi:hypothetical protein
MPEPGLAGHYRYSRVVWMRGTHPVLSFGGETEWLAASLPVLGVPVEEAGQIVSATTGCRPAEVPHGTFQMWVRVRADCVSKAEPNLSKPTAAHAGDSGPCIGQPR